MACRWRRTGRPWSTSRLKPVRAIGLSNHARAGQAVTLAVTGSFFLWSLPARRRYGVGPAMGTVASGRRASAASNKVEALPAQRAATSGQSDQSRMSKAAFRGCGGGRRWRRSPDATVPPRPWPCWRMRAVRRGDRVELTVGSRQLRGGVAAAEAPPARPTPGGSRSAQRAYTGRARRCRRPRRTFRFRRRRAPSVRRWLRCACHCVSA